MVSNAQHLETLFFKPLGAHEILIGLVRMTRAIYFDDKVRLGTIKIYDEGADGMLAAKFEIPELAVMQNRPKLYFCSRHLLAKFIRLLADGF